MEQTISTLLERDESMIRKNKNNNENNNLIKDITYKSKYENQDNNINNLNNRKGDEHNSFSKKEIVLKFKENKIEELNILHIDENDITYSLYYDQNESPNPLITSTISKTKWRKKN